MKLPGAHPGGGLQLSLGPSFAFTGSARAKIVNAPRAFTGFDAAVFELVDQERDGYGPEEGPQ